MDLQIQSALLGQAFSGQRIEIDTKDGKTHDFTSQPHRLYSDHVWLLSEQKPKMIEKVFPNLRATWETPWRPSFYKIYVDCKHPIAVNCPLYLRAVPDGMGFGDEGSACLGAVAAIRIM